MSLDQRAQILEAVTSYPCGIRDLLNVVGWKTSRVIFLLKVMSEERLVEFQLVRSTGRGRPRKTVRCTFLGLEFLEAYRKLRTKPLRARKQDMDRAVRDALYTKRLVESDHSPFRLFMELNAVVRNIRTSSETAEAIRE